jgi:hypothetical protein
MSDNNPYMKTLALCLNKVVKDGYTEDFKISDRGLSTVSDNKKYSPEEVHVVNFFRFEGFSDPGDNSILYVIETDDGKKGTLIDAYGPYADEKVNKFMQQVPDLNKKEATQN